MAVVVRGLEDVKVLEGKEAGVSDWILVDQARIDRFAAATDDYQWIHTDPERAAKEFEMGTTIAHGYLTISLIPAFVESVVKPEGLERQINYGINKARFRSMVPTGSRLRGRFKVKKASRRAGSVQIILECAIEMEGEARPVATAEIIIMYFFAADAKAKES